MYSIKTLMNQPLRFLLTVFGIALCVILMLFLLSVYKGVETGSVEYVKSSKADLWILQRHATNILRCTSLLSGKHGIILKKIDGIKSVSPVLFILANVKMKSGSGTVYLTGYDPQSYDGGPPKLIKGKNVSGDNDIVLDQSFAAKYSVHCGDKININDDSLVVSGICGGTNMFVIQYAFITIRKAHSIIKVPNLVSCYQVRVKQGENLNEITARIHSELPDVAVFNREIFLGNNINEMESGILPLLFVVATIGAIVITAILSLILTINVLERRTDYAILKALGAPNEFIKLLVIKQAFILAGSGAILGLLIFFPLIKIVERFSPEVQVISSAGQIIAVITGLILISLISSILPNQKLQSIYPLEVFR